MRRWVTLLLLMTLTPGLWAGSLDVATVQTVHAYENRNGSTYPAGYVDGWSLYNGYFAPNALDPSGLILFAFDGTGNYSNDDISFDKGGGTNVWKMAKSYSGKRRYYGGLGNEHEGAWGLRAFGLGFGAGGSGILRRALGDLMEEATSGNFDGEKVDIIGFSRGASLALEFANQIKDLQNDPKKCQADIKIRFIGLYDTVASFGLPGNFSFGKRLYAPDGIIGRSYYVAHAVSMDEVRTYFPVVDVVGANVQRAFRGVHSDIGGGYADTGLSDISLSWMLGQGMSAGAPFTMISGLRPNPAMLPHREFGPGPIGPRKMPVGLYNPFGFKPPDIERMKRDRNEKNRAPAPYDYVNPFYTPDFTAPPYRPGFPGYSY